LTPPGLAALDVTDHVPGDVGWQAVDFGLGLFDAVFPKVPQPQFVGSVQDIGRLGFGHGD